jgi:NADH dehydrogenase/NADH:ubiquinone oxidoreductase subunit G
MIFEIDINNKPVKVKRGETIKSVLDRIGINVPTLCSMKEFTPTGMCRMCVVEVEGRSNLIPSCSFKVEEWMKIKTHSPRVIRARKTIVELLLANHPDDCLYCERNGTCELHAVYGMLYGIIACLTEAYAGLFRGRLFCYVSLVAHSATSFAKTIVH